MDTIEILLFINTLLLGFISLLFFVIGYFLKEMHREFKQLVHRVNQLFTDLHSHIFLSKRVEEMLNEKIRELETRIKSLEASIMLRIRSKANQLGKLKISRTKRKKSGKPLNHS